MFSGREKEGKNEKAARKVADQPAARFSRCREGDDFPFFF